MILSCEGVTKAYGGLVALRDLSFSVGEGELFAVVGPNGAGKTTLFDVISGIAPPSSGTVRLGDRPIHRLRPHQICRLGLCRTFQTAVAFGSQSVLRNVLVGSLFGREGAALPWRISARAEEIAREALEACGLAADAERSADCLPVLGRKRLMLATALACRPRVLLLDEPFGGLNPAEREELTALVRRLRGRGLTILMIEHVIRAVKALADRVLVLHHGERLAEGPPAAALADPRVVEVYLGRRAASSSERAAC